MQQMKVEQSLPFKAVTLFEMFPFAILLNSHLEITLIGESLRKILPNCIGKILTEYVLTRNSTKIPLFHYRTTIYKILHSREAHSRPRMDHIINKNQQRFYIPTFNPLYSQDRSIQTLQTYFQLRRK